MKEVGEGSQHSVFRLYVVLVLKETGLRPLDYPHVGKRRRMKLMKRTEEWSACQEENLGRRGRGSIALTTAQSVEFRQPSKIFHIIAEVEFCLWEKEKLNGPAETKLSSSFKPCSFHGLS